MQLHFKSAYAELAKHGVPVFQRPDHQSKGNFAISAEEPESHEWVSYHNAAPDWVFGVHPTIDTILTKHGLFAEWETPGSLNVYDI